MLYLPNYAGALRCIGQALQTQEVAAFELRNYANEFRLLTGDPNPPFTALIELSFSSERIKILDREGQARRGQSSIDMRFDSLSEILRAVGEYVDRQRGHLLRVDNSGPSIAEQPAVEVEYQTRAGDVRAETLPMGAIRETSVQMYKRRTRLSNPISTLTRSANRRGWKNQ
jgi:hypothetical protein